MCGWWVEEIVGQEAPPARKEGAGVMRVRCMGDEWMELPGCSCLVMESSE